MLPCKKNKKKKVIDHIVSFPTVSAGSRLFYSGSMLLFLSFLFYFRKMDRKKRKRMDLSAVTKSKVMFIFLSFKRPDQNKINIFFVCLPFVRPFIGIVFTIPSYLHMRATLWIEFLFKNRRIFLPFFFFFYYSTAVWIRVVNRSNENWLASMSPRHLTKKK
jgi:hypothetical protein